MNFRPELADAVMAGTKTCTRRLVSTNPNSPWWEQECGYRVGQIVAICPGRGKYQIGKATVTSVEKMRLGFLKIAEGKAEGFEHGVAFEESWIAINGKYEPDATVWRIGLEAIR